MCYYKMLLCAAALCAAAFAPSCRHRPQADSAFDIRVYAVGDSGYGYSVFQGARKLIDQPNIPGVPGRMPFRTREDAEMTAQLVNSKLQAGLFPPAVSIHELDSLRVHYQ
jgi:hypothetical protein